MIGKYTPYTLILNLNLKLEEHMLNEKRFVLSLVFLADDGSKLFQNYIFSVYFPFRRCMIHDTQKLMYNKRQEWIMPYIVVSSWFQNKDISWPTWLDDLLICFNPEALVEDIRFYYIWWWFKFKIFVHNCRMPFIRLYCKYF